MLKIFGLALILVETTLVASLPTSLETIKPFKNDNRIVGGHEVNIAKHPHQISMRRRGYSGYYSHICGGSIFKANIIITAAHCVYRSSPKDFIIVAGTNIRTGSDGAVSRVSKIVMNEKFNPYKYNNDIAIMVLATPIPLNNVTIAPITLISEAPKNGVKSVVTGWGTTSPGGYSSNKLQEVDVPIISNDRCDAAYADTLGPGRVTESMICAGVEGDGGKDACQGDSGGPLLVKRKLAGIVSWGISCALPDYPGVYTNVAHFKDWIETKVQENA